MNSKYGDRRKETITELHFLPPTVQLQLMDASHTLTKQNRIVFCLLVFPSNFLVELSTIVLFYNSSSFGKCLCVPAYSLHTDSTINADVNFGVNFGS